MIVSIRWTQRPGCSMIEAISRALWMCAFAVGLNHEIALFFRSWRSERWSLVGASRCTGEPQQEVHELFVLRLWERACADQAVSSDETPGVLIDLLGNEAHEHLIIARKMMRVVGPRANPIDQKGVLIALAPARSGRAEI